MKSYTFVLKVYGHKLSPEELRATVEFDTLNATLVSPAGPGFELDIFPWIRFIPFLNKNFKRLREVKQMLSKWYSNR